MPRGDKLHIMSYLIAAPLDDDTVLGEFNERMIPIQKAISDAREENVQLAALRDWLLPMLINGQLKLSSSLVDAEVGHAQTEE